MRVLCVVGPALRHQLNPHLNSVANDETKRAIVGWTGAERELGQHR